MSNSALRSGLREPDEAEMPAGWRKVRLGSVARFCGGGRLRLTKESHYQSSGFPAYSAAGQDGFVARWEFDEEAVVLPSIGSIGRAYRAEGRWTTLANTQVIFPRKDALCHAFLHHRVDDTGYWPVSGTAQPFIKPSELPKCWLSLPPLPEQGRIAEILDTIDEAIRRTEQVIAKLQQMKQGLLHDILTRGIDDHGELRNPTHRPDQFKNTPLGLIPREWQVVEFGSVATSAVLGTTARGMATLEKNVPLVKMGNLGWGHIDVAEVELVAEARVPHWRSIELLPGDLLFNTRNTPELVGKTAVWGAELPTAIADNNILRVRFHPRVNGFFVGAYMSHGSGKAQVHRLATGTTSVAAIYWKNLKRYCFPLPPLAEQVRAVTQLQLAQMRLTSEEAVRHKLRALRLGLMEDLLAGRVRVTDRERASQ